jgi:hypothetical protein
VFKLLLTVFLGVCVGAVVADLLFGPDQPATPSADSTGQQWEPWRSWYRSARDHSRRVLAAVVAWTIGTAEAVDRGARRLARSTADTVRLVPDTLRSIRARRAAVAERTAAHARHVAHREAVTPRQDPLPPAVGPSSASPSVAVPPVGPPPVASSSVSPPVASPPLAPALDPLLGPGRRRNGPPMSAPDRIGPPVPASMRGQEEITTSELPATSPIGERERNGAVDGLEPLGRPPWDALVRRPTPAPAVPPSPGSNGPGSNGPGGATRTRRRGRRDPLAWMPDEAERPPDPEWDEGVPVPLMVPRRVRARSAAVLLALTGVFGVLTATAFLVAVIMAVGALDRL